MSRNIGVLLRPGLQIAAAYTSLCFLKQVTACGEIYSVFKGGLQSHVIMLEGVKSGA